MVKKAILTALFFVLVTGLFSIFASPVLAQACTSASDWPGVCTQASECNEANKNIEWTNTHCDGILVGCCGVKPGSPEESRPDMGDACFTDKGWPGYCTTKENCSEGKAGTAYDPTACKVGGCCGTETAIAANTKICDFAGANKGDCELCMGNGTAAWTALGCIPTDPQEFIGQILGIAIGIGGGIAFLLILFGGFQILMSAGNPEKLNAGKELVTSALSGLLIIIFSIFILRLIGVSVFGIPGFQ